jgi:DNA gyrase inhibitor GyrI
MRIEEVGALGWYDNPEVTRQELARVDAILAVLEE